MVAINRVDGTPSPLANRSQSRGLRVGLALPSAPPSPASRLAFPPLTPTGSSSFSNGDLTVPSSPVPSSPRGEVKQTPPVLSR
jgi:hypothetical protein